MSKVFCCALQRDFSRVNVKTEHGNRLRFEEKLAVGRLFRFPWQFVFKAKAAGTGEADRHPDLIDAWDEVYESPEHLVKEIYQQW